MAYPSSAAENLSSRFRELTNKSLREWFLDEHLEIHRLCCTTPARLNARRSGVQLPVKKLNLPHPPYTVRPKNNQEKAGTLLDFS
jgi:hypothetical protein